ncbi:MAG: TIGR02217 family protein [Alphaproteobacteria bacterium]|nr:MAG: TIGR02217 family protein [Alphaproteobacteria bacterium]TAF13265.1 MAG: TIGR02217 family protein [Alphaproteobacteria bacterium]TAF38292.1 MAG: TIGR02217 family protein [Alphaproteobacteria bacterium]TAF77316.1 MAG: TIGR02217 family protein [Alphaproteobacteria bacterium]
MPAFHEIQFPPKIAYGASGGPEFNTTITTTQAGFEQRNINWQKARGRWDVSTGIKSKTDMDTVIAFFRARFGRAYGFRFKDWSDYQGVNQSLGTGNGTKTAFQLVKNYFSGSNSYSRDIKKPVSGTVKIYLNSILQSSGFTIDHTTGMVTFSSAPANGVLVNADFDFDVPVRFDADQLAVRIDGPGQYLWDAIPIVEIRL